MTTTLEGGFASASEDSARIFRSALNAMARPGQIEAVSGIAPPSPLSAAAGALLLTLADHETPVFLAGDPLTTWLSPAPPPSPGDG